MLYMVITFINKYTFNQHLVHADATVFAPNSKQELTKAIGKCVTQNPYPEKCYIYALELEDNKYYVGKTSNRNLRISEHFAAGGGGAAWTRRHKPVKVLETRESKSACDEQTVTQEYMGRYGMDNVRGGPWCKARLTDAEEEVIGKFLQSNDNFRRVRYTSNC